MTEHEAIQLALEYANTHGLSTRNAVLRAEFEASSSPLNIWKDSDDKWMVIVEFPLLQGMDPNYYVLIVNCRTREVSVGLTM